MTLKEQMWANFPKTVKRNGEVFSAMVANDEGTAAFEYELINLMAYMKEWVSTPNVYEQSDDMLDKTVTFLSYFERFSDETDASLKNRFGAVFVRNHNEVWGTPYDIKTVFAKYFPSATVFLIENTNDTTDDNLISDGDFTESGDGWTFTGSGLSTAARFSKTYGVSLEKAGKAVQTVELSNMEDKTYFLHFFMKGSLKVGIKNNAGKYWNSNSKSWTSSATYSEFVSEEWEAKSIFILTDSEMTSIEFEFLGNGGKIAYFDYVRLFEKKTYPSFTVVAQFEADSSKLALKLAPGQDDPSEQVSDYEKYDYYDQSFVTGVGAGFAQDIYNDLLNLLRANGVKAYLEILTKDYIEE